MAQQKPEGKSKTLADKASLLAPVCTYRNNAAGNQSGIKFLVLPM